MVSPRIRSSVRSSERHAGYGARGKREEEEEKRVSQPLLYVLCLCVYVLYSSMVYAVSSCLLLTQLVCCVYTSLVCICVWCGPY